MKKILMTTIFTFMFALNVIPSYALKFHPLNYDKRIDLDGGYGEFTITNTSKDPMRWKISALNTKKVTDISRLVTIYPNILTVEPLSEKSFKVYVKEDSSLKEGEYSFLLDITPLKTPNPQKLKKGSTNQSLEVKQGLCLEVFAYVGDLNKPFELSKQEFYELNGKRKFKTYIKNNNKRGYELAVGFTDKNNVLLPTLHPIGRLFDGVKTKIDVEIPEHAKNIVFYDYSNFKVLNQSIKIK